MGAAISVIVQDVLPGHMNDPGPLEFCKAGCHAIGGCVSGTGVSIGVLFPGVATVPSILIGMAAGYAFDYFCEKHCNETYPITPTIPCP